MATAQLLKILHITTYNLQQKILHKFLSHVLVSRSFIHAILKRRVARQNELLTAA